MEALELQPRVGLVGRVGVGKMGEDTLDLEVLAGQRGFQQVDGAVVVNADALHAGVDLQVHLGPHAHRPRRLLDLAQLLHRRRGQCQVMLQKQRHLIADDAAQHEDGRRHARLAQQNALFQKGHAEIGRAQRLHVARHLNQPVAVGVGLQDGHDGRGSDVSLNGAVVGGQAGEIDFDLGGAEDAA